MHASLFDERFELPVNRSLNLVRVLICLDVKNGAVFSIIIHERLSLPVVSFESIGDNFGGIVGSLDELGAIVIADALNFGFQILNVVNGATLGAASSSGHPRFNYTIVNNQV